MKKIGLILFLLFVLVISCKSKTQVVYKNEVNYIPYYLKVYEADSLYIIKDYEKSYKILDSLFKKYEPLQLANYYEVNNYYKLKIILNKKINILDFSELISKYRLTDLALKNDSIFNIIYLKEKKYFVENYILLRKKYLSTVKINLRNELKNMAVEDQFYRKKDYEGNIKKQTEIDSLNSKRLIEIFKDYGYPNEKIIGEFNLDNVHVDIGTMLLHTNDYNRLNIFLPKVLEFIKKGMAPPRAYATMFDQYNLYHGQQQYYGSYTNPTTIKIKELNKRRKQIGMPSYTYEKWKFNKLYPNEEY
jgi:hypothetical protein